MMGGTSEAKREEGAEEEARTIHRWIALSELVAPRDAAEKERKKPEPG